MQGETGLPAVASLWMGRQSHDCPLPTFARAVPSEALAGSTGKELSARRTIPRASRPHASFFGQCVYSDTCTGFPKSFPHGFTGMINFCDEDSGDRDSYYLCRPHDPAEVSSAVRMFHATIKHHLNDEKIWMWQTDNGSEF